MSAKIQCKIDIFQYSFYISFFSRLLGKCTRIPRFWISTPDSRLEFQLHVGDFKEYILPVSLNLAIGTCGHKFYMVPTYNRLVHSTFLSRDENQTREFFSTEVKLAFFVKKPKFKTSLTNLRILILQS